MKRATITEAKNGLSALIDRVRAGETILIVDRGVPVARLEPATRDASDQTGRLERLERAGLIRRGSGQVPDSFFTAPRPRVAEGASVLDALLEERRDGR